MLTDNLVAEELSNWVSSPWRARAVSDGVSGTGGAEAVRHLPGQAVLAAQPHSDPCWPRQEHHPGSRSLSGWRSYLPIFLPLGPNFPSRFKGGSALTGPEAKRKKCAPHVYL